MKNQPVLVTGGAGYIGSHTCRQLIDADYRVVVVDNLYSGHQWAVPREAELIVGDAGNIGLVRQAIVQYGVKAVIHFAGHIVAPESVKDPLKYYRNNACVSRNLIEACVLEDVSRFIFSSSAAVYGNPELLPVTEDAPTIPISPYGTSKLMTEWILRDVSASRSNPGPVSERHISRLRYAALRYFNVAGARLDCALGQATPEATHLIKVACEAACGKRGIVSIFGTDYATPDGTCIRDYVHVEDIARAHLDALLYLERGGESQVLNCGYGKGYSVREVLNVMREVSGVNFTIVEKPRRAGDMPELIADNRRIQEIIGWKPKYDDIQLICESAYRWEKSSRKIGAARTR